MKHPAATLFLLSFLLGASAWSQAPVPVGVQFQINSYTTDSQRGSAIALDSLGNFVVVWESLGSSGTDTDGWSIQAQRYDADGASVGGEFQVNSYTTGRQWVAGVASDALGNFVVVWTSDGGYGTDTSDDSVQAQLYDSSGTLVGGQFQVNSYTTNDQYFPSVAVDPDGDFVVVWQSEGSYGTDTDNRSIQAQLYDASGTPVGGEFQVNSYTTNGQTAPAVAEDAQGRFVVVWQSFGSYGADTGVDSVQAQRYDATGTPVGGQFQVNTLTRDRHWHPAVAADAQGNFVVVWDNRRSVGTDNYWSIQGRLYDANGTPVGGQFQVNSYTTRQQTLAAVSADVQGDFVVVWQGEGSYGNDFPGMSIQARLFNADGSPLRRDFQVNSYTTNDQYFPSVAVNPDGDLVVVWVSNGSNGTDTSESSIQGERYEITSLSDGFESGDTSAWSKTVP